MKSLCINFAPQNWRHLLVQTSVWLWLALIVGATLCIVAAWSAQRTLAANDAKRDTLKQVQLKLDERTAVKPAQKTVAITDEQAHAVNAAVAQLNLPWRDVFDAMEAATPKTIALLTLDPDAKRNVVRGTAEAKSSDDMIAYIEKLKKQGFFSTVILTKHEINEQDPNKPLRFQFEAQWTGAVP